MVQHFERRLEAMDGKAMVVCMSRRICVDLYNELIKLRPDWASAPDDDIEADIEAKLKIAQALRQSILRHTFTGQLVPQDPQDEPAAELLTRIAAQREERARLLKVAQPAKKSPTALRGRKKATP